MQTTKQPPARYEMLEGYPDVLQESHMEEILGRSGVTVRRLAREGLIPAKKISGKWYFPKSRIIEFLEGAQG